MNKKTIIKIKKFLQNEKKKVERELNRKRSCEENKVQSKRDIGLAGVWVRLGYRTHTRLNYLMWSDDMMGSEVFLCLPR